MAGPLHSLTPCDSPQEDPQMALPKGNVCLLGRQLVGPVGIHLSHPLLLAQIPTRVPFCKCVALRCPLCGSGQEYGHSSLGPLQGTCWPLQSPTQMSPQTYFLPQFQDGPAAVVPSHSLCPFGCSSLGLPSVPGCRARAGDARLAEAGWTLPHDTFGLSEEGDLLMAWATQSCQAFEERCGHCGDYDPGEEGVSFSARN